MIKAVFFDIDGTLIDHDTKMMPDSTKKALALLQNKGIKYNFFQISILNPPLIQKSNILQR